MNDELGTSIDIGTGMTLVATVLSTLIVILMVSLTMAKSYINSVDRAISYDADKCVVELSRYGEDIPVTQLYATLGQLQPDSIIITSTNPEIPATSYKDLRKYFTKQTSFEVVSENGKCKIRLVA